MDGTVLVADDDRTIRTVLTQALTRAGCRVHATSSLTTLMRWVEEGRGDLVVTDVVMPDGNGLEEVPKIRTLRPRLPVIVISAQNTIMTAIQAAEAEAFDYLPKPFDLPDLMKRCARALENSQARTSTAGSAAKDESSSVGSNTAADGLPLVGHSAAMQALYRMVARVIHTDIPVLISGESGVGKSLIARAIHDFSDRKALGFTSADPSDLSDIDGPARLLERAGRGTLLLDAVENLNPIQQAHAVRLLGMVADGAGPRVISTSDAHLSERMLAEGQFREDLYFRLCGVPLAVPALRDRIEDIEVLAHHFLELARRSGATATSFSAPVLERLCSHPWPGNVRQLENLVMSAALTAQNTEIRTEEVDALFAASPRRDTGLEGASEKLSGAVMVHLRRYFDLHGGALPPPGLYGRILREIEVPLLEIALEATGGNQARCADLLGINRNTLRKKISELEIAVARRRKLM